MLQVAEPNEFGNIRAFYWDLIDLMKDESESVGWKKGIYPSDELLRDSLQKRELFVLRSGEGYDACVILNSSTNEGYAGLPWHINCFPDEVIVPHALGVHPSVQSRGIGREVVSDIISYAESIHMKAVRLDILGTNTIAEKLYTGMGFRFIEAKNMYYEDTGWTEFKMFERGLGNK